MSPKERVYTPRDGNEFKTGTYLEAFKYLNKLKANQHSGVISSEDVRIARNALYQFNKKSGKYAGFSAEWEELGPNNVGGRTRALLIDRSNSSKLYAGSVSGGVWVSTDATDTWTQLSTDITEELFVSTMVQASNGDIYIGTGTYFENLNPEVIGVGGSGTKGTGLYKWDGTSMSQLKSDTADGGDFAEINKIAISSSDVLFAATGTGLFRSSDGGSSWTEVSGVNSRFMDVEVNGNVVVASRASSTAQLTNAEVYVSTNGGSSFTKTFDETFDMTEISYGDWTGYSGGRAEIAIAPSNSNIMYLSVIQANSCLAKIFISEDMGSTFTEIAEGGSFDPYAYISFLTQKPSVCQGTYDNAMAVNPRDPYELIVGGIELYRWKSETNDTYGDWENLALSTGASFSNNLFVHADKHSIVYHPTNSNIIYVASDGGIGKTINNGATWTQNNKGYNVTQFYTVSFSNDKDNDIRVVGGTQDNGTQVVRNAGENAFSGKDITSGDGFSVEISSINPEIVFASVYFGNIMRLVGEEYAFNDILDNQLNISTGILDNGAEMEDTINCDGSDGCGPFFTRFRLWETFQDPYSTDSVWYKNVNEDETDFEADTTIVYSSSEDYPLQYTLTAPLAYGDSILLPDSINSMLVFSNVESRLTLSSASYSIFMSRKALNPGEKEWFKIASDGNRRGTSYPDVLDGEIMTTEFSRDGNYLFVGTDQGKLFRISNLAYAKDYVTADIRSPYCVVTCTQIAVFDSGRVVTGIAVDQTNPQNVIVVLGNYGNTNYIYRSTSAVSSATVTDSLGTFVSIQGDLPSFPIYSAVIDFNDNEKVILGTEFGVYATDEGMSSTSPSWTQNTSIAGVPIFQLKQQQHQGPTGDEWKYVQNPGVVYAATHGRGLFKTTSFTTGISPIANKKVKNDEQLIIYPNPASNKAFVRYSVDKPTDVELIVYNLEGKRVLSKTYKNVNPGVYTVDLDLQILQTGTYLVGLTRDNERSVSKLIVTK